MGQQLRWIGSIVLLFALVACARPGPAGEQDAGGRATPSVAVDQTPPTPVSGSTGEEMPAGRMAFMGPYGPSVQVFVMNADGSGLRLVSDGERESVFPSLSPDGTRVAYTVQVENSLDLVVTEIESGETDRLTESPEFELQPVWSPDGSKLAFLSNINGTFDLFVMDADGSNVRPLVQLPESDERLGGWSPDGSKIVFVSETQTEQAIMVVDVESGEVQELTRRAGVEANPTYSPDGTRIAFYSDRARPGEDLELYVMGADGSDVRPLTDDPQAPSFFPVWSPDGRWIAYAMLQGQQYVVVQRQVESGLERRISGVDGIVTSWVAADEPLADTGFTQEYVYTLDPQVIAQFPTKGSPDAPVVIVEFSDYQCPFCKRFFDETLPALTPYIEDGTVRLVLVDFPIDNIHPQARPAAQAAYCAADQAGPEAYWRMHDVLFGRQEEWAGREDVVDVLVNFAEEQGLNGDELRTCVEENRFNDRVELGLAEGTRLGVNGTPTFFVNGRRLVGAQPFEVFAQIIEEATRGE